MKKLLILIAGLMLLTACSGGQEKKAYDYTALKQSKPKSILVVMPVNNSVEAKADTSVLARASYPLAELGYYVYPVALVDEMFKQNGLTDGNAIRNASLAKIYEIFGADSVFYININEYGTSYKLVDSITSVELEGKLVDTKTGQTLWQGTGAYREGVNNSNSNIFGMLINAALSQIIDTSRDKGYRVAAVAMRQLSHLGSNGGLLVGPKHPNYDKAGEK
ncbi:DUF799 domain-containing protein [Ursidibacter sp. B-7004-1]